MRHIAVGISAIGLSCPNVYSVPQANSARENAPGHRAFARWDVVRCALPEPGRPVERLG
jgi:hypothetical protein